MTRKSQVLLLLSFIVQSISCGSGIDVQGDAHQDPGVDVEVGDPVALGGIMFRTQNDTESTVYAPNGNIVQEIELARNLGAGWETITLWPPSSFGDIECPSSPEACECPTPFEFTSLRQITPGDDYSAGWAPSSPSSVCYLYDLDFCAECRCFRPADILPGQYSATRCVFTDYECIESEPCGPESVGYFRPARGAGEERCYTTEFSVPGSTGTVTISVD